MLALLLLLQEPNLDQRVSLEVAAQGAPAFLSKLSERVGFEISAPGTLRRNTLVVRFEDTPLRTVLDRVADALSAKWQVVDKQRVEFYRPASLLKALQAKETAERRETIQKGMDAIDVPELTVKLAQAIARQAEAFEPRLMLTGRDAQARADRQLLEDAMPIGRAAGKAAKLIPIEAFLALRAGERVVLSSHPNRMQRPFPSGRKLVEEYNSDRTLMRAAMTEALQRENEMLAYSDPRWGQFRIKAPAEKVIVAISRNADLRGYFVSVRLVDREGWILGRAYRRLYDTPIVEPTTLTKGSVELPRPLIDLNRAVREIVLPELRAANLATTTSPATREPHSWLIGELILDFSRKTRQPLAAALSDRAFRQTYLFRVPDLQPSYPSDRLAQLLTRDWNASVSEREGCVVVTPRMPLSAEREYLDRKPLETALHKMIEGKRLAILDASEYAAAAKSELAGLFFEHLLVRATSPNAMDSPDSDLFDTLQYPTARFVGHVPSTYLAQQTSTVSVIELPANARQALSDRIFFGDLGSMFEEKVDVEHPYSNIAYREPTAMLPEGIPGSTRVRFTWSSQPFIYTKFTGGVSLHPYKWSYYYLDRPDSWQVDVVTGRCLTVDILLPDGNVATDQLWEAPPATTERNWRRVSDLPAEVLDLLRAEKAKQASVQALQGGYKPPPP